MENKKKNLFKRIALVCFAMFMVTSAVVGVTFAKYVREQANDEAGRVAKFGVTLALSDADLIKTAYKGTGANIDADTVLHATDKLVAPGTAGEQVLTIGGDASEVALNVAVTITVTYTGDWTSDGTTEYKPLVVTVSGSTGITLAGAAGVYTYSEEYEAGEALTTGTITVAWAWPFEGDDVGDTYLGTRTGEDIPNVAISIVASATQID